MLDWVNTGGAFQTRLADKAVTNLTFKLTDWAGRPLDLGVHWLVLRIDTFKRVSNSERLLSEIVSEMKTARLMRLTKALS
jgi:hypothetical protein